MVHFKVTAWQTEQGITYVLTASATKDTSIEDASTLTCELYANVISYCFFQTLLPIVCLSSCKFYVSMPAILKTL